MAKIVVIVVVATWAGVLTADEVSWKVTGRTVAVEIERQGGFANNTATIELISVLGTGSRIGRVLTTFQCDRGESYICDALETPIETKSVCSELGYPPVLQQALMEILGSCYRSCQSSQRNGHVVESWSCFWGARYAECIDASGSVLTPLTASSVQRNPNSYCLF
jgi:hypothetical protein